MKDRPQMIVVGGPNGAGKTTFVYRLINEFGFSYLGADKIAAEIAPDRPESVAFEAGRLFMVQVAEHIDGGTSFIVESTLSGRSFAKTVQLAKNKGFAIDLNFVFVSSAARSIERVAERVRKGGHHVPDVDVRRRFSRSLANFWQLYRPLANRWSLFYNGPDGLQGVARSDRTVEIVIEASLFELFQNLMMDAGDD